MIVEIAKKVFLITHRSQASSNTYLIDLGDEVVLIDPGLRDELQTYVSILSKYKKIHIIHTHMHYDHIASTPYIRELFRKHEVIVYHHKLEVRYLEEGDSFATLATLFGAFMVPVKVDEPLEEGYMLIGKQPIGVVHAPGHTIGSIVLLYQNIAFSGDTLFSDGAPGRTDLPTGSRYDLSRTLEKLREYKASIVAPGHGNVIERNLAELAVRARLALGPYV